MKKAINIKLILAVIVGAVLGVIISKYLYQQANPSTHPQIDSSAHQNQMWTCSMHPQIMQPEPGDCPICGMDLIPAEAGADGLTANQFKLTANAIALADIRTAIIGGNVVSDIETKLSGTIASDQNKTATMPAHYNGRIEKLYIKSLGQRVTKGQAVAQVYAPELVTAQQELLMAYRLKDTQPSLYKAIRNKFINWKISETQISGIEASGKTRSNFTIYSHVDGVVTEILATEGSHVMEGKPIFKVADLTSVWANFDVYENQIAQFKEGQKISIMTKAYPNKLFQAKVNFIDPILDPEKRTITLRTVLNNKAGLFKPGMFVEGVVKGVAPKTKKTIQVPSSAVLWTGERSVVYVKVDPYKPVFEMRNIVLGGRVGDMYEVLDGLLEGEAIVTNGTFTVDAAAQLQGKKSMMSKEEGEAMTGHERHNMGGEIKNINFDVHIETLFHKVIDAYIDMKDAFVQSDIPLVANKSELFRKALEEIPVSQRAQMHNYWSVLHKASERINENVDLVHQRKQFRIVSDKLIELVQNFNTMNKPLYVQFCPMAENNKGGYWLSKEEKTINPYFGEAMLTCGEVKQVIE